MREGVGRVIEPKVVPVEGAGRRESATRRRRGVMDAGRGPGFYPGVDAVRGQVAACDTPAEVVAVLVPLATSIEDTLYEMERASAGGRRLEAISGRAGVKCILAAASLATAQAILRDVRAMVMESGEGDGGGVGEGVGL